MEMKGTESHFNRLFFFLWLFQISIRCKFTFPSVYCSIPKGLGMKYGPWFIYYLPRALVTSLPCGLSTCTDSIWYLPLMPFNSFRFACISALFMESFSNVKLKTPRIIFGKFLFYKVYPFKLFITLNKIHMFNLNKNQINLEMYHFLHIVLKSLDLNPIDAGFTGNGK